MSIWNHYNKLKDDYENSGNTTENAKHLANNEMTSIYGYSWQVIRNVPPLQKL